MVDKCSSRVHKLFCEKRIHDVNSGDKNFFQGAGVSGERVGPPPRSSVYEVGGGLPHWYALAWPFRYLKKSAGSLFLTPESLICYSAFLVDFYTNLVCPERNAPLRTQHD
jgi:hypothetical protein